MCNEARQMYLKIARDAGIFIPSELGILDDILGVIEEPPCHAKEMTNPDAPYMLFEEKDENGIIGFIIFGRTPMTEWTWDIYWLVVNKPLQHKGVGKRLVGRLEEYMHKSGSHAIIRIETSSHPEYASARQFYRKMGFSQSGIIPNFYAKDDDLIIFHKEIFSPAPKSVPLEEAVPAMA